MDDAALQRLYAVPPEEFVAVRNALAKELVQAGNRKTAEEVKSLRKPTVVVWALNRVARDHRDGVEALEWLSGRSADVMLVDLRMPRMSGIELFATLEATRPELADRVLFLSGDVSQLAEPGNTPVPRERVLVKPVELAVLEERVAQFVAGTVAS